MKSFKRKPKFVPELDPGFMPIALQNREYRDALEKEDEKVDVKVALVGPKGFVSRSKLQVFPDSEERREDNIQYIERLVKSLLWIKGGYKIVFAGPDYIGDHLKQAYIKGGAREWDVEFLGNVYEREIEVEVTEYDKVPESNEKAQKIGRNLDGCRIGFDAGGSDRKVSAVIDGEAIYSEEVVWHPKITSDPEYHYQGILDSVQRAAEKMPRVDAIGISAAGIYIDNQARGASLFREVSKEDFEARVRNIFYDVAKNIGDGNVPIEVANDGDVTALAGAMSFDENRILGIAMGTSEAVGYVDKNGNITGWLNELAFVPVDYSEDAIIDEWSLDRGVGVSYFSQDAIIKLAPNAGIELDPDLSPAEKLKVVQKLMEEDDKRAIKIYENIGIYLGYSLAYYADFYDINKVLLLGRVVSGKGGDLLIEKANEVLKEEFNELYNKIELITPDEKMRRVGQSIAAASLPNIED